MPKSNFTIRALEKGDALGFIRYESVLSKERAEDADFGQMSEKKPPSTRALKKWFSSLYLSVSEGDTVAYVAEMDGRLVGLCSVMRRKKFRETLHVGELGIDVIKEHRSKGFGSALIRKVLEKSKGNFEIIEAVDIFSTNKVAIRLYKKFGFKKCGVMPRHIKKGNKYIDEVLMSLML